MIHDASHTTGGLKTSIREDTDESMTARALAVDRLQEPLAYGPSEPPDEVVIPSPGFTSAFYYDPYVEIKDFLDALKSGASSHAPRARDLSVMPEKSESRDTANGEPSESQPHDPALHPECAAATEESATEAIVASVSLTPETTVPTDPAIETEPATVETKAVAGDLDPGTNGKLQDATPPESTASGAEGAVESSQETPSLVASLEKNATEASRGSPEPQLSEGGARNLVESADAIRTLSSAKSPDTATLRFAASITASFAPQTKSAWAQLFGSRYEDEIESRAAPAPSSSTSRNQSAEESEDLSESRLSLKAKLERERKLDQQIQASQQRFKERSLRREPQSHSQQSPKRRTSATAPIPLKPFEMAGLSITSVRFCVEKALQATCKCFQQLHALALNEPRIPKVEAEHGVFVSQWELEVLLQDLFGPPREGGGGTTAAPSSPLGGFALANPMYMGVPLELLLQITWFIPFDQLPRLRSLTLQITRKHLNEHKLAVLNRHLQKQLLRIPYSTRLQQVLLQFSGHRACPEDREEPHDDNKDDDVRSVASTAPPLVHCTSALVRELLECIAVPVPAELLTTLGDKDFLLLSPVSTDSSRVL